MWLATLPAHLLFIALVALIPATSAAAFRELQRLPALEEKERLALYRQLAASQWILAAVAAGAAGLLSWEAVAGWLAPPIGPSPGNVAFVLGTVFGALALALHERRRRNLPELLRAVSVILPRTRRERNGWALVSVTAGVCEEIIYRGFLFLYLGALWPGLDGTALVLVAALVFGAGHLYQGAAGFMATSAVGIVLGGIFLLTGSLWLPILIHALVDLRILWIGPSRPPPDAT